MPRILTEKEAEERRWAAEAEEEYRKLTLEWGDEDAVADRHDIAIGGLEWAAIMGGLALIGWGVAILC